MDTKMTSPIAAMQGSGFYNRHSSVQAAAIATVLPLWEKVSRAIEVGEENLVIADYGSSQGHNSMVPLRVAIEALRTKFGHQKPVEVIHADLPSNDFASLFQALEEDPSSYLVGANNIFPLVIGRSYFNAILPPGRVHLGWNSWTLHWMSRKPVDAPDHAFAEFSASPRVRAAVAEQQAEDWRQFLLARSSELRPGGKLLSLIMAKSDNGRFGWKWLRGELWATILDMRRAGLLSEQEKLRITVPTAQRSLADIRAPFDGHAHFAGLKLECAEIVEGSDPYWDDFQKTGDAEHLGQRWGSMMRAVLAPTITLAIDPHRNRIALVDDLFARFAARIAEAPRRHEHYFAVTVFSKTR
jgi:hypothetical protein